MHLADQVLAGCAHGMTPPPIPPSKPRFDRTKSKSGRSNEHAGAGARGGSEPAMERGLTMRDLELVPFKPSSQTNFECKCGLSRRSRNTRLHTTT